MAPGRGFLLDQLPVHDLMPTVLLGDREQIVDGVSTERRLTHGLQAFRGHMRPAKRGANVLCLVVEDVPA